MLNQIKTLLNIEVKLEEMKLENGTIVTADSFEKDKEIFIVTDDEKVAMPVGEYMLEDGRLLVVSEEGMIGDMRDVSDDVPSKEDEDITSDLKDKEHDYKEEDEDKEKKYADEGNYVTKDSFKEMEAKIQNLEDAIADLKGDKESKMEDVEEQEMADDVQGALKSRTVKEEFSEAASKPIKHNPEGEVKKKKVHFAKGKMGATALDRVLNKLNK